MALAIYILFLGYNCLLQINVAQPQIFGIFLDAAEKYDFLKLVTTFCTTLGHLNPFTDAHVTFLKYPAGNPSMPETLDPKTPTTSNKQTYFVIHDFLENMDNADWIKTIAILIATKFNADAIVVNYNLGSNLADYARAAAGIQLVVKPVVDLIKAMKLDPTTTFIIGHGFGGQIGGQVGKQTPNLGKIIASDPAGLCFDGLPQNQVLNINDAKFVIIVHTNAGLMGSKTSTGHVDFYPNGGQTQDDCNKDDFVAKNALKTIANDPTAAPRNFIFCSHRYGYLYLVEAFTNANNCVFCAQATTKTLPTDTDTASSYTNGCKSSSEANCNAMYGNSVNPGTPTKYYLKTNKASPFCITQCTT